MLDKNKRFKIILGTSIPIFVVLLVIGFCLLMIGYHVGSQADEIHTNWVLVIVGWVTLGIGLTGYFTMFAIVLIKRQLAKKKLSINVPQPTITQVKRTTTKK